MRSRVALLGFALVSIVSTSAATSCGSRYECEPGAASCVGNTARICSSHFANDGSTKSTGSSWSEIPCGSNYCVATSNGSVTCALAKTRDPECPPKFSGGICKGNDWVTCEDGFAKANVVHCTGACVPRCDPEPESANGNLCAGAALDPDCAGAATDEHGRQVACDGIAMKTCRCGHRVESGISCKRGTCTQTVGPSGNKDLPLCAIFADKRCGPTVRDATGKLQSTWKCAKSDASAYVDDALIECSAGYLLTEKRCDGCRTKDGTFACDDDGVSPPGRP